MATQNRDEDTETMLGEWLRHARGKRPQSEVAARIGMEQGQWSNWETGRRKRPKPHQIMDFARALDVSVESVALAYAGIWPGDRESTDETALLAERMRTMEIPPDVKYDELLILKHIFRGLRGYKDEVAQQRGAIVGRRASQAQEPSVRAIADQRMLLLEEEAGEG